MTVEIKQCPSGFWAIFVNGEFYYAASPTKEHAEKIVSELLGGKA